jgi:hypothetical protein
MTHRHENHHITDHLIFVLVSTERVMFPAIDNPGGCEIRLVISFLQAKAKISPCYPLSAKRVRLLSAFFKLKAKSSPVIFFLQAKSKEFVCYPLSSSSKQTVRLLSSFFKLRTKSSPCYPLSSR